MSSLNRKLRNYVTDDTAVYYADDLYVIENSYMGTYADLSHHDEQELIEQFRTQSWRDVVNNRFFEGNPWLYKIITDPGRSQFLDLINMTENGTYLDVGSGWGQITIPLSKRGFSIAFDLTKNRLDILRCIADQEKAELGYIQGNFVTFPFRPQSFDLVVFNGSLEWIGSGRGENQTIWDSQVAALKKASDIINSNGIVYVGIENSLGAKYLTGIKDDHTGIPHLMYLTEKVANEKYQSSEERRIPAKTWSLTEYYQLFQESNLVVEKVYACFPDYKLIRMMIEINDVNNYFIQHQYDIDEYDGSDGSPILMSSELRGLYQTFAKNGLAQYICPSYGFVLRKKG